MTPPRPVARSRMPVGTCLVLALLVLSLLVSAGPAYAATHISGTTYTSNTTWTLANSPYVLDGNVTVASGATLTIEPGVIVKFNGIFRELSISGTLSSVGTSSSHIVFTSYQDDSAGGDTNGDGASQGSAGQWYAMLPKQAEPPPQAAREDNSIRLNLEAPKMKPLLDRH